MNKLHVVSLLVLALSAATPPEARAQDTPQQRIEAARRRAASTGIPVGLLDSKVAEGRAKGVPMERIAGAVERRLASLARAREAMAGLPRGAPLTSADLTVGADALEAGVEPRALGRLAAASPGDRRAVAIAALTELVNLGLSSELALQRVTAALARGPEALRRLPGEAAAERSRGNGPPAGRGRPSTEVGGRGRGQGGPPASVPGPTRRPEREEHGKGKGKP